MQGMCQARWQMPDAEAAVQYESSLSQWHDTCRHGSVASRIQSKWSARHRTIIHHALLQSSHAPLACTRLRVTKSCITRNHTAAQHQRTKRPDFRKPAQCGTSLNSMGGYAALKDNDSQLQNLCGYATIQLLLAPFFTKLLNSSSAAWARDCATWSLRCKLFLLLVPPAHSAEANAKACTLAAPLCRQPASQGQDASIDTCVYIYMYICMYTYTCAYTYIVCMFCSNPHP